MKSMILFCLTSIFSVVGLAHGEDKPGPHGGHIQMPANFHTEVIPDKDGSFHIFLLDMEFKNPTVADSEIKGYVQSGKKKTNLKCSVMGNNHFHCTGSKPVKQGKLVLKAKRAGTQAGTDAVYQLPLKKIETTNTAKPEQKSAPATDHSHHH